MVLLVLVTAPLLLGMGVVLSNSRRSVISQTTEKSEVVADLNVIQVQNWVEQGRNAAWLVSEQPDVKNSLLGAAHLLGL